MAVNPFPPIRRSPRGHQLPAYPPPFAVPTLQHIAPPSRHLLSTAGPTHSLSQPAVTATVLRRAMWGFLGSGERFAVHVVATQLRVELPIMGTLEGGYVPQVVATQLRLQLTHAVGFGDSVTTQVGATLLQVATPGVATLQASFTTPLAAIQQLL